jgi:tetratricopeptide (TPR) repeat protein
MPVDKVFLNYRRDDSEGYVGRLYDHLNRRFPGRIFRDVTELRPGEDFVDALEREGQNCKVLLAVIGRHWLTVADASGHRRLDDPRDILRQEIVHALQRNILVVPVLVGGANMPPIEDLPADLGRLGRRQALPISELDFEHDMERLIRTLEQAIGECAGEAPPPPRPTESQQSELLSRARSAIARQDWSAAIPALQSALALNPADSEAAGQLQFALRQKELATLFAKGQALYQRKDYPAALACFQQLRALGGNYNDVDSLITQIQLGPQSIERPKPKRLRWIVGSVLATIVVLAIVGLVNQQPKPPVTIVDGPTTTIPVAVQPDASSTQPTTSQAPPANANATAWMSETASALMAIKSWRDHITTILTSAPATVEAAQSMARQLLSALDSYDQQLNNLTVLLRRGEQEHLITSDRDRSQAQAIDQVCDIRKEQSAKLRYEAQLLLQFNPNFGTFQNLQAELMSIDAQIRDLDMRAAQIMTTAGLQ